MQLEIQCHGQTRPLLRGRGGGRLLNGYFQPTETQSKCGKCPHYSRREKRGGGRTFNLISFNIVPSFALANKIWPNSMENAGIFARHPSQAQSHMHTPAHSSPMHSCAKHRLCLHSGYYVGGAGAEGVNWGAIWCIAWHTNGVYCFYFFFFFIFWVDQVQILE